VIYRLLKQSHICLTEDTEAVEIILCVCLLNCLLSRFHIA